MEKLNLTNNTEKKETTLELMETNGDWNDSTESIHKLRATGICAELNYLSDDWIYFLHEDENDGEHTLYRYKENIEEEKENEEEPDNPIIVVEEELN